MKHLFLVRSCKIVTIFLTLSIGCIGSAQEISSSKTGIQIIGKIVDSITAKPLEYAAVSLLADPYRAINGTVTASDGSFTLNDIVPGTYAVVAEFIGYQPDTLRNVLVKKSSIIVDLHTITLISRSSKLAEVTVTSQAKLVDNKIDKLVFNAEKDITSQAGAATDVLRKVPQVSVGIDGTVELAGNAGIRFLINGKPSSAFGSNIADVLQSIPANQIKSIEVITNPGARYDAQGTGGIINIILKKNNAEGINGNMAITAGSRTENGSFNFNARKGKLAVNAFVSGNTRLKAGTPTSSDRITADTTAGNNIFLHQQEVSGISRDGFQAGGGFDWTVNNKNSLSGAVSYNRHSNKGSGYIDQAENTKEMSTSNLLSNILSRNNISNSFLFKGIDASLDYKRTFDQEDKELNISLNSSFGNNHRTSSNDLFVQPADVLSYSTRNSNPGSEHEYEFTVDYEQPLKEDVKLGTGGKINFVDIGSNSNILKLDNTSHVYVNDPFLSNILRYHQKVYAAYAELTFPITKSLDAKVGGRYERTEIDAFYSNAQSQARIPGYNTFVPTIYLRKKLGEDNAALKLSYSRRIERPDYGDLNPFVNTADPKNFTAGNIHLQPEVSDRVELAYNRDLGKSGSFMVNAFYRINMHDIQPFVTYYPTFAVGDTVYTDVNVATRENIGTEKNLGLNVFTDLRLMNKMSIRTNLFFFHRDIINAINKGYNTSSFNYRFNLNTTYQFTGTLAAEFFGNFNSPRNEAQGRYPSFTTYSFAIRKQFWNKNASIALTTTNPFKDAVDQGTAIYGPNFSVSSLRSVPFRSFGVNFTWKFGHLEFKKDKDINDNGTAAE